MSAQLNTISRDRAEQKYETISFAAVSTMSSQRDSFLVIGGSGFLGRHIVEALVVRGDPVAVFDIVQRYHDTPFYSGDISDQAQVSDAIRKVP